MYFKKLELVGFKSFMHKTVLNFEPGITAIVGPNGCGKSNIFDSIRWVLGEQSVKSLRGSQMEDVIFNGTDSKPALGMAEVSLTFDNRGRFFAIDDDELIVTRRVFQSGESDYLINRAPVRLKDILDLLMGTGIGAESYSLVAQGKIDLILSSRPEDRRLVFDEAAGITKYKSQKREALRKLDETEQNLVRVNDIVTEVKRQIGSLERQASKARRYKETFEELKTKEISIGLIQKEALRKQKYELGLSLDNFQDKEDAYAQKIKEAEEQIAQHAISIKTWEGRIEAIKGEIIELEHAVSRDAQHVQFNHDRLFELEENKLKLKEQVGQATQRLAQDEEKLNLLIDEQIKVKQAIAEKTLLLEKKEKEFNEVVASIKTSLERIADSKRTILDAAAKTTQARNEITDLAAKEQIYLARKKRLEIERAKAQEEKAFVEEGLARVRQEVRETETSAVHYSEQITQLNSQLVDRNRALSGLEDEIAGFEKQLLTMQSYKEFLDKLKIQYEDIATSMNAVVHLDKPLPEGISGLIIKVKDIFKDDSPLGASPAGVTVKVSGEAKPIDLDEQRVTVKIVQIEEKIKSIQSIRSAHQAQIGQLNNDILAMQQKLQETQLLLANKQAVHQNVEVQLDKLNEELQVIGIELSDVSSQLSELNATMVEKKGCLQTLEEENKRKETLIHDEQKNIETSAGLKEEIIVRITQIKTELDALARRVASEENTLKSLEDDYQQDKDALNALEGQLKEGERKKGALADEIKGLEARIIETRKSIECKNATLKTTGEEFALMSRQLKEISHDIEGHRQEIEALKDSVHSLQMQDKELDFKYSGIKERLLQAYKVDLDAGAQEMPVLAEPIEEEVVSGQIQALREKLDSYGTVNLVAIEEYDELKKRYDFLIQQQGDLGSAKESLQEAIRKINQTTKKMFLETFEKVSVEFKNYFRLLFNGGDAQLFLIDEQNPLESGIEIICRPPGKKLQNVLLLSGGEKSMSAIALIFAVFKVKPAPFCILDEIDAALDEANVDRFGRLFQEFIKDSQFIVITHNKRTIANANVMYGITMEESGVSKIVSVKFGSTRKEPLKEEEPVAV
ncbi:MAG: hypothetical protein C4540_04005 [Candidatus Omnitrophota bacterium]|nr:MAG: hypothetical protein C4540_04005 [Candidatus Omnitrophota bacterium]